MSEARRNGSFISALARRWPIIAIAVLAGALVGAAYAMTDRAEPTWEGSVTMRYTPPSAVTGAPTPDTFVAMALSPSVQRSAAESIGVEPEVVIGSVSAAISPRDRTIIIIRAEAPSADAAVEVVEAVAEIAIHEALEPVRRHTEYWEGTRIAEAERQLAVIEERSENLSQQIEALGPDGDDTELRRLEDSLYTNELRAMSTRASIEHDRFTLEGMRAAVTIIEDTAVEPKRTFVYDLTSVVRGALVGAFAGALVASVMARRETWA